MIVKESPPYLFSRYGSGTICSQTGSPRVTEVRYTCLRTDADQRKAAATVESVIWSVEEKSTCMYVMAVCLMIVILIGRVSPYPSACAAGR